MLAVPRSVTGPSAAFWTCTSAPTVAFTLPICAAVGPPGRRFVAAHDQVVGRDEMHVERERREQAGLRRGVCGAVAFCFGRPLRSASRPCSSASRVASSAPLVLGVVLLRRDDVGQRLFRVRRGEDQEDLVDLERGGVGPHLAFELRLPHVAGQLQVRFDVNVAELVVDTA